MAAVAECLREDNMLSYAEPMSRHTSWRVGGPARRYFQPENEQQLAAFLAGLPEDEPLLWLGLGSNLLVRDGGFPGTVIALQGGLNKVDILPRGLRVQAGVSCAKVARLAARAGLCGVAFLGGIPGTMGGALAMNAGAFGGETWDRVAAVKTIDRQGVIRWRQPAEYTVAYRQVERPRDEWFIACELHLETGDADAERERIGQLLRQRNLSQPIGQASAGSTFRNPPGDFAARLIEQQGLKGYRIGGAQVSPKHANFIINTGAARAADIEALIRHVQTVVEQATGIELETEVHIVGEEA